MSKRSWILNYDLWLKRKMHIKILLASMKTFPYCFESRMTISLLASLSVIGRFYPVSTPHWMQEKPTSIYMS
jgi:hypothetical protein